MEPRIKARRDQVLSSLRAMEITELKGCLIQAIEDLQRKAEFDSEQMFREERMIIVESLKVVHRHVSELDTLKIKCPEDVIMRLNKIGRAIELIEISMSDFRIQ